LTDGKPATQTSLVLLLSETAGYQRKGKVI